MLKYLIAMAFVGASVNVIAAELPEVPADAGISTKLKVIDPIVVAVTARDSSNHILAQKEFEVAFGLLQRAIGGDTNIDSEGRVGKGTFIEHPDGSSEEETYYDSGLPLSKRAANLAYYAADSAEHVGDFLFSAQFYTQAGDLHSGDAPAQIWYKKSAENYSVLEDYESALSQINKAGEVAIKFYPLRASHLCLVSDLATFCSEQAAKLMGSNAVLAATFTEKAKEFGAFEE